MLKAGLEKEYPVICKANRLKRFTRCWGRLLALRIFGSEGLQEVSQVEGQCWKIDIRKPKIRIVLHLLMFSTSVRTRKITSETWRHIWSQMHFLQSREKSEEVKNAKERILATEEASGELVKIWANMSQGPQKARAVLSADRARKQVVWEDHYILKENE